MLARASLCALGASAGIGYHQHHTLSGHITSHTPAPTLSGQQTCHRTKAQLAIGGNKTSHFRARTHKISLVMFLCEGEYTTGSIRLLKLVVDGDERFKSLS